MTFSVAAFKWFRRRYSSRDISAVQAEDYITACSRIYTPPFLGLGDANPLSPSSRSTNAHEKECPRRLDDMEKYYDFPLFDVPLCNEIRIEIKELLSTGKMHAVTYAATDGTVKSHSFLNSVPMTSPFTSSDLSSLM